MAESTNSDTVTGHAGLKAGALSWVALSCLGIACVVSGDYAGWNFGLQTGGWGGLLIATILTAILYSSMCAVLVEMATIESSAGGGAAFARRAFGPLGGFLTGVPIFLEYLATTAAVSVFTSAALLDLFGKDITSDWFFLVLPCLHIFLLTLHSLGVTEALSVVMTAAIMALLGLLIFAGAMVPHANLTNLFDVPINADTLASSGFLPMGIAGVFYSIPYGMWFFLGIEAMPLAAEEARDPSKSLPRALGTAMSVLLMLAVLILLLAPSATGSLVLSNSANPLLLALDLVYKDSDGGKALVIVVTLLSLCGLLASYASGMFAASRLTFDLARAGYFPKFLTYTNRRQAPFFAIILPGIIQLGLALTRAGDRLILVAVFGAIMSYVCMMITFIALRINEPLTLRPFKAPFGLSLAIIAIVLSVFCMCAVFAQDVLCGGIVFGVYLLFAVYFLFYGRYHITSDYQTLPHIPTETNSEETFKTNL